MTFKPAHKPAGTPAGGQFTATAHAEPDHIHLMGVPDDDFEHAVRQIAFHSMASKRWKEEAADGLMGRGSFDHSQLCITAWRAVDRAGLREIENARLLPELYEFRDRTMERYEKHLPEALEMVETEYLKALGTVGRGGLFDATEMDVTRKALKHEIAELAASADPRGAGRRPPYTLGA
ncbi:hypothetical protein [Arthrobacter methylotrophus]|uniref:Uncharacterized protein n=1 Tax=Arthrobacter methylotrophus TaxID=121291 RepID=A0ABV5UNH5_9MICC